VAKKVRFLTFTDDDEGDGLSCKLKKCGKKSAISYIYGLGAKGVFIN